MNKTDRENMSEVIRKLKPKHPGKFLNDRQFDDFVGMQNQFNHTLYELYQHDLLSYDEYSSNLLTA